MGHTKSSRNGVGRLAIFTVAILVIAAPIAASTLNQPVVFELIETRVDDSGILVFNGTTSIGGNWTAVLLTTMEAESGLQSCTATLVGQKALLTAAHCVSQGTAIARDAQIRVGATKLTFLCKMSDEYGAGFPFPRALRAPEDFALCSLKPGTANIPAKFQALRRETIDLAPLKAETPVLITGYGCTKMDVDLDRGTIADPPFDPGVFSAGDETIEAVGSSTVSTFSRQAKEPALCNGDSGGPLITGASVSNPDGIRRIRGVNSKVSAERGGLRSQFAALASESFRRFLSCWRKRNPDIAISVVGAEGLKPCDAR